MTRLPIIKTWKLFIDGKFPRSESGRSLPVYAPSAPDSLPDSPAVVAHIAHASRKDLRDAVEAARKAQPGWQNATAYLRGQILYRMAEMLEGKASEFADVLYHATTLEVPHNPNVPHSDHGSGVRSQEPLSHSGFAHRHPDPRAEVSAAVDRLIAFAGWADKYAQVLGCNNAVASSHYNFTTPEPSGVVAVLAPDHPPLLSLVSLLAPALAAGNTVVAVASQVHPVSALLLGEVCATGDVPPGVLNILSSPRAELVKFIAEHRDIDAVHTANLPADQATTLRSGVAENIKRVTIRSVKDWHDAAECQHPWWIEPLVEMKTVWHPSGV